MSYLNLIDGKWTKGRDEVTNINPSCLTESVGTFTQASDEDIRNATSAASEAFPSWSQTSPQVRADILEHTGSSLIQRQKEVGELLAREEGKTLPEAIGEVVRAGQIFKFFAGEALRNTGDCVDSIRPGIEVTVQREPLGVIGLITPWNFPIAIPAWKTAAALAYGNTVILKPANLVPASAWQMANCLQEAGCPAGVFNLLMGSGRSIGAELLNSPKIAAISFTGSESTGQHIRKQCAETGKRAQLEMGGKNPLVVLKDADLDIAVEAALNGAFFSTGQRCTASSRLVVESSIHDAFVDKLTQRMSELKVGPALDPNTQIGPVAEESQLKNNLDYITLAQEEGCEVVGGERIGENGYFQKPALLLNAKTEYRSSREEIFGPVASVIPAQDTDEALALANDSIYGLTAGVCTTSLQHAHRFRRSLKAGVVMINLPTAGLDYHVPFGGTKASSYGPREQGSYAKEFYTVVKTSYTRP